MKLAGNRVEGGGSWLRTLTSKESFSVGGKPRFNSQGSKTMSVKYELFAPPTNTEEAAAPVHAACLGGSPGFILAAREANGKLESMWGRDFP